MWERTAAVSAVAGVVRKVGGWEPIVLLVLLTTGTAGWAFIEVADAVLEGETQTFDERVVRMMRQADDPGVPVGPQWLQEAGRDATALGGLGWLIFFIAVVAGYMWLDGRHRMMVFMLSASGSGLLLSLLLKRLFSRPRPGVVPHLSHVMTSSFPSGHSMLSAVVYLTLGSLLAAGAGRRSLKVYLITVAAAMTLLVGTSRVYLGVHYPTDVLAGWLAGTIWALLCWLLAHWLQRRGQVEQAEPDPDDPDSAAADAVSSQGSTI
ncbi:MAG: phosphatase PAP2 family protein [Planctomycetaceae bacterium]|nr:phosphatase PAP2 family protein [Planctomycetaceae bacterium]